MRALPVLWLLLAACNRSSPGGSPDPVDVFRVSLADNTQQPIRAGLKIDDERLKAALAGFQSSHRDLLEERFRASLDALPKGTPPGPPFHGLVIELDKELVEQLAESTRFIWMLEPDATRLARMSLSMTLPLAMSRNLGMSAADVGGWMGFLAAARPKVSLCDRGPARAVLCVDYGGLDVFVVTALDDERGWRLGGLAWHQLGRAAR